MKEIISWTLLKFKTSVLQKAMSREWEDRSQLGENTYRTTYLVKDYYSKYTKKS